MDGNGGVSYCEYLEGEIRKTKQDNSWLREQIDNTRNDNLALQGTFGDRLSEEGGSPPKSLDGLRDPDFRGPHRYSVARRPSYRDNDGDSLHSYNRDRPRPTYYDNDRHSVASSSARLYYDKAYAQKYRQYSDVPYIDRNRERSYYDRDRYDRDRDRAYYDRDRYDDRDRPYDGYDNRDRCDVRGIDREGDRYDDRGRDREGDRYDAQERRYDDGDRFDDRGRQYDDLRRGDSRGFLNDSQPLSSRQDGPAAAPIEGRSRPRQHSHNSPGAYQKPIANHEISIRIESDIGAGMISGLLLSDPLSLLYDRLESRFKDHFPKEELQFVKSVSESGGEELIWQLGEYCTHTLEELGVRDGDTLVVEGKQPVDGTWSGTDGLCVSGGARVGGMLEVSLRDPETHRYVDLLSSGTIEWFCMSSHGQKQIVDSNVLSYIPTEYDLDSRIQVEFEDASTGSVSKAVTPIICLLPAVQNAEIKGSLVVGSLLTVVYDITGGECTTGVTWQTVSANGGTKTVGTGPTLRLAQDHEGARIRCVVTPVLVRGNVAGIIATVEHPDVVITNRPVVNGLELRTSSEPLLPGVLVEPIANVEGASTKDLQQPKVEWCIDGSTYTSQTYTLQMSDIGKRLDCMYTAITKAGMASEVATAALFIPRLPLSEVNITGAPVMGQVLTCVVVNGGADNEEEREYTWSRSLDGGQWKVVQSESSNTYQTVCDDVGYQLRCNVSGLVHKPAVTMISLDPDEARGIAQAIDTTGIKGFNAVAPDSEEKRHIILTTKYLKLLNAASKAVISKKKWSPSMAMTAKADCVAALRIDANTSYELQVKNADDLRMLILTFRCFHAIGMPQVCKQVFGVNVTSRDEARSVQTWELVRNPYEIYASSTAADALAHTPCGIQPMPEQARSVIRAQAVKGDGWIAAWLTLTALARCLC